jgi:hypothetical protein
MISCCDASEESSCFLEAIGDAEVPGDRPSMPPPGAAVGGWPTEGSLLREETIHKSEHCGSVRVDFAVERHFFEIWSGPFHWIVTSFPTLQDLVDLSWASSAGHGSTDDSCQARSVLCRIRRKCEGIEDVVADRLVHGRGVQVFVARSPEDHATGNRRTASHRTP